MGAPHRTPLAPPARTDGPLARRSRRPRFGLGHGVRLLYPACFEAGDDVTIEDHAFLRCLSERGVRLGSHTSIHCNLWLHCGGTPEDCSHGYFEIGDHCYIGRSAVMGAGGGIIIGDCVVMGPMVAITAEQHHVDDPGLRIDQQGVSHQGVVIEDDCWIGAGVTILDGVRIGHGSVIGAGAVVTKNHSTIQCRVRSTSACSPEATAIGGMRLMPLLVVLCHDPHVRAASSVATDPVFLGSDTMPTVCHLCNPLRRYGQRANR